MTPERSLAFSALSKPPSDLACAVAVRTGIGVDTVSIILDAAGDLQRQRIDQLIRANNAEVERRRAAEAESRGRLVQVHALTREVLAQRDLYTEQDARFRDLCKRTGGLGGENIYSWCADRLEDTLLAVQQNHERLAAGGNPR